MTTGSTGYRTPRRYSRRLVVGVVALGVAMLVLLPVGIPGVAPERIVLPALLVLMGLGGFSVTQGRRDRQRYERWLADQAVIEGTADLRLAVARDLHDKISHTLGFIVVHASVAQQIARDDLERLLSSLADIEQSGRDGLADLRKLVSTLYDGPATPGVDTTLPLDDLIDWYRDIGGTVELVGHSWSDLDAEVQVRLNEAAKESLLNVARHAGPTAVVVESNVGTDRVSVRITDDGPVPGWVGRPGTGRGLSMLADRIERLDGTVSWQHTDSGGFTVCFDLPLENCLSGPPTAPVVERGTEPLARERLESREGGGRRG